MRVDVLMHGLAHQLVAPGGGDDHFRRILVLLGLQNHFHLGDLLEILQDLLGLLQRVVSDLLRIVVLLHGYFDLQSVLLSQKPKGTPEKESVTGVRSHTILRKTTQQFTFLSCGFDSTQILEIQKFIA